VREDRCHVSESGGRMLVPMGAFYGAAPGRGFALRMMYGSVAARRGAPCGQVVCDSLEETCVRGRRKRTTPVWVHQGQNRKVRPLCQACQGGGRPQGLEVALSQRTPHRAIAGRAIPPVTAFKAGAIEVTWTTEEPAIAYYAGPVPEVIEEGTTGFIVDGRAHPTLS
jgi:hypothetical protein